MTLAFAAFVFTLGAVPVGSAHAQEQSQAQEQGSAPQARPDQPQQDQTQDSGAKVLQSFEHDAAANAPGDQADQTRRWVMFGLGAPLLVLLLATGALGVAMGVYGKPVYLAHMICAGLSITLAIVHAIVGLVWFRPF
jgi:hypothetical protein